MYVFGLEYGVEKGTSKNFELVKWATPKNVNILVLTYIMQIGLNQICP